MVTNCHFEHIQTSPSTNTDLLSRWRNKELTGPTSLMADTQTAGRGRRGRNWLSSPENSLTFSIAYPFNRAGGVAQLSGLSLMCGLSVIYGISEYFQISLNLLKDKGLSLKWPNDILINQAKLAGILVEGGQTTPNDPTWMIAGVGINLSGQSIEATNSGYGVANLNDLFSSEQPIDREKLWKAISHNLIEQFGLLNESGFTVFKDDWNEWNAFKNQAVNLSQDGQVISTGKFIGINDDGALLIETDNQIKTVHNGELSLRLSHD